MVISFIPAGICRLGFFLKIMRSELIKIINNEIVDYSTLYKLQKLGFIQKITYSQYVITAKGLKELNN